MCKNSTWYHFSRIGLRYSYHWPQRQFQLLLQTTFCNIFYEPRCEVQAVFHISWWKISLWRMEERLQSTRLANLVYSLWPLVGLIYFRKAIEKGIRFKLSSNRIKTIYRKHISYMRDKIYSNRTSFIGCLKWSLIRLLSGRFTNILDCCHCYVASKCRYSDYFCNNSYYPMLR